MKNKAFTPLQILERKFVTGFTVQELVFVLILVVILARVAIPVYQTVANQSKAASVRATLDEVRAAIKAYRMNERLSGRSEGPPIYGYVMDKDDQGGICSADPGPIFQDCDMPNNPFSSTAYAPTFFDYVHWSQPSSCTSRTLNLPQTGWCYDLGTGEFWAATSVVGENQW